MPLWRTQECIRHITARICDALLMERVAAAPRYNRANVRQDTLEPSADPVSLAPPVLAGTERRKTS